MRSCTHAGRVFLLGTIYLPVSPRATGEAWPSWGMRTGAWFCPVSTITRCLTGTRRGGKGRGGRGPFVRGVNSRGKHFIFEFSLFFPLGPLFILPVVTNAKAGIYELIAGGLQFLL